MFQSKVKLVIDYGNSETRAYVLLGKKTFGFDLSNRFAVLDKGYKVPEEFQNSDTSIFSINDVRVANGQLVEHDFSYSSIRPTAVDKKYESPTTEYSTHIAILHAMRKIAETYNVSYDNLDLTFDIICLLPPLDMEDGIIHLEEMIRSIKEINFIQPKLTKKVKIDKIKVLPEGVCAYFGVLMDKGLSIRDSHKFLVGSTTLIIDIGAGTTDFCVVKDNKVIEDTKDTFEIGGNNISQKVRRKLKAQGYTYPDSIVQEAVITGTIKDGAKVKDITDIIEPIKRDVATNVINEIKGFFEATQFPIRTIEYLIVCGGGSEGTTNGNSRALSEYLIEYLRELSSNTELVELPEVEVNGKRIEISPRRLNIIGATILAETF